MLRCGGTRTTSPSNPRSCLPLMRRRSGPDQPPRCRQAVRASIRCSVTESGSSSNSTRFASPGSERWRLIASDRASRSSSLSAQPAKLPGKIIPCNRRKEPALSVKGEVIDLWYSGKAHAHGGNVQAVLAPNGFPLWVSEAEPGSVHDISAARAHAFPALYPAAAAELPALADPGYKGAGADILIPVAQPVGGGELDINTRTRNAIQRSLRCLGERGFAPAHRPLAHPPAHHSQPQQDRRHRPRRARPHPFRIRLRHVNSPRSPHRRGGDSGTLAEFAADSPR